MAGGKFETFILRIFIIKKKSYLKQSQNNTLNNHKTTNYKQCLLRVKML